MPHEGETTMNVKPKFYSIQGRRKGNTGRSSPSRKLRSESRSFTGP